MRVTFFLICALVSSAAYAQHCNDLSGSYKFESMQSEKEPIVLVVQQNKCESIRLQYSNSKNETEDFTLNGKRVKHSEFPEIGLTVFVTPYIKGPDVVMDVENVWQDGQRDKFKRRLHLEFTSKTLLLDQIGNFRNDGVFVPSTQTVYQRDL